MATTTIKKKSVTQNHSFNVAPVQTTKVNGAEQESLHHVDVSLAASFLRTIIYFDVFLYPLNEDEIFSYCDCRITDKNLAKNTLQWLVSKNCIGSVDGFYLIGKDDSKVSRRITGNELAEKRLHDARFYSKIIASFPFTRGVYISGSLSKNYMDEESDIDYFIIAKPGRLWLNRSLLVIFKRIFLFNSHRNFCINYLIDTDNLEIQERNIYAATETLLLLPLYNQKLFKEFLAANSWCSNYYPNFLPKTDQPEIKSLPLKKLVEKLLDNQFGEWLDKFFFKLTVTFWNKKHKDMNPLEYKRNFHSTRSISRYHPHRQQFRVIDAYQKKIFEFESATGFLIGSNPGSKFRVA